MVANKDLVDKLLKIRDLNRFTDVWRSDEAVVQSLVDCFRLSTSVKQLNSAVSRDPRLRDAVDSEDIDSNINKIWRRKFQIIDDDGAIRAAANFYYFGEEEVPDFPTDTEYWQKVYKENRFRRLRGDASMQQNDDEEEEEKEEEVDEPPQQQPQQLQQARKRRRRTVVVTPTEDPIVDAILSEDTTWTHRRTRKVFGVPTGDVKAVIVSRIDKLELVISGRELLETVLSKPHDDAKDLAIKQEKVQYLVIRCMYLRTAYSIALERFTYGMESFNWAQCCEEAIDNISDIGITTITSPRTLMRWNQQFRGNGEFNHPHQLSTSFTPFLFREYPQAKEEEAEVELSPVAKERFVSSRTQGG